MPRSPASASTSSDGARAVARHEQRDAEVDRAPLGVVAVADDDDVALADLVGQRPDVHRQHPDPAVELAVARPDQLAVELLDDRLHRAAASARLVASRDSRM